MMITPPDLELTLPARPENVGVIRHVLGGLGEALDLDLELLEDVRLAVSEACANVVIHAYAGQAAGLMDVDVHLLDGDLQVSVRDHGGGMAPRADSPGLGVGLPLMASLAGSMELLSPPGGGTEVRMRFPLPAPRTTTPDDVDVLRKGPSRPGATSSHGHEGHR